MAHRAPALDRNDDEPLADAVARARLSYGTGAGVEHRVVALWLRTWGEPDQRPFGEWLAAWDG